eukprot:1229300-Pyramimonas_sp.AAC.1
MRTGVHSQSSRFVAPQGVPPKAPVAGSHAYSRPCRRALQTFRVPIGSFSEGSSCRVRMRTR